MANQQKCIVRPYNKLKTEIKKMKYIKSEIFSTRDELRKSYQSKTPFRYLVIDNIFNEDAAKEVHEQYPEINRMSGTEQLISIKRIS